MNEVQNACWVSQPRGHALVDIISILDDSAVQEAQVTCLGITQLVNAGGGFQDAQSESKAYVGFTIPILKNFMFSSIQFVF